MRMEGQYKAVESCSERLKVHRGPTRSLDIQKSLVQERMASEGVDCNVTEKELTIPGEDKKLDTKEDGTVDKRLSTLANVAKNYPHYK